ncbi:MAG: substrate-binding domain-containing protein, partial [Pseudomonadota bacterium]|nr:substrate-binding domain-containing protein [Pseudomonadota bacterium]
ACDQAGYNLLIRPLKINDEGFEPIIKQMHERSKPDGYLICPPLCDDPNVISLMDELDVPYVRIAPLHSEGSPYVRCQEEAASQKAVEHLINLGHQRIAMLSYLKGHGAGAWRLAGYKAALDNYNIPIVSEYIEEYGYDEEPNILDTVIRRLLTKTSVRPTAIFCVNDTLAASVYRIASQMGLKIPYDISIVGFDDDPMVENLWPPLTTIRQPISTMGNYAARMLIKALGNKQQALELPALDCELVLRSSTGPYLPD